MAQNPNKVRKVMFKRTDIELDNITGRPVNVEVHSKPTYRVSILIEQGMPDGGKSTSEVVIGTFNARSVSLLATVLGANITDDHLLDQAGTFIVAIPELALLSKGDAKKIGTIIPEAEAKRESVDFVPEGMPQPQKVEVVVDRTPKSKAVKTPDLT